jgi:hypothetical protein
MKEWKQAKDILLEYSPEYSAYIFMMCVDCILCTIYEEDHLFVMEWNQNKGRTEEILDSLIETVCNNMDIPVNKLKDSMKIIQDRFEDGNSIDSN